MGLVEGAGAADRTAGVPTARSLTAPVKHSLTVRERHHM